MECDYKKRTKEDCLKVGRTLEFWIEILSYYEFIKNNTLKEKETYIKNYGRNPRGALASRIKGRIENSEYEIERANYFIKLLQE